MAVEGMAVETADSPTSVRDDQDGFSLTRRFRVKCDDRETGPLEVLQAVGLPQRGFSYFTNRESHPFVHCVSRNPSRIGKGTNWLVDCEYRSAQAGDRPELPSSEIDPVYELPQMRGGTSTLLIDLIKDAVTGEPIVNSAGDRFKPHPKIEARGPGITITRNEPLDTPIVAIQGQYTGKTNSAAWFGNPARFWQCVDINWEVASKTSPSGLLFVFLSVTYQFAGDPQKWKGEYLNHGWWYKDAATGERTRFKHKKGDFYEWFLNANGTGQGEDYTPTYTSFNLLKEADFGGLQLPQSPRECVAI